MELLVALGAPALEIRRKILEICGELVSSRNVDEVIQCLRKEITKSQARDAENGPEYRQLLIKVFFFFFFFFVFCFLFLFLFSFSFLFSFVLFYFFL